MLNADTKEITGGVLSTVTLTAAEAAVLPAASRATAVRPWAAFVAVVVGQEIVYGAAVTSAPKLTPSSLNCTPTTPTLSVALAETVIVPETVALAAGAVMETVGGVVSTTVSVAVLLVIDPLEATMPAEPGHRPWAIPELLTDAIVVLVELNTKLTPLIALPFWSLATAVNCWELPIPTVAVEGLNTMLVRIGLETVTLTALEVAVLPAASRATAVKLWEPLA